MTGMPAPGVVVVVRATPPGRIHPVDPVEAAVFIAYAVVCVLISLAFGLGIVGLLGALRSAWSWLPA